MAHDHQSTSCSSAGNLFKCNICCKPFKTKQGCKTHLLSGHKITDDHLDTGDKNTCEGTSHGSNVNKTSSTKRKLADPKPVPKYNLHNALIDGQKVFLQAMRKLKSNDILQSTSVLPRLRGKHGGLICILICIIFRIHSHKNKHTRQY
ncbi:uncharacterized protein LOC144356794 [Saccoglossus kowalevskii]